MFWRIHLRNSNIKHSLLSPHMVFLTVYSAWDPGKMSSKKVIWMGMTNIIQIQIRIQKGILITMLETYLSLWYACMHDQLFPSCPTLCDTWTLARQASLSMKFPRQENWSGLPFPPPGDLLDPGIKPKSPGSPALQVDSLMLEPLGKPNKGYKCVIIHWTNSIFCFVFSLSHLLCFSFIEVQLANKILIYLRSTAWYFGAHIHCEMIATIKWINISVISLSHHFFLLLYFI